VALADESAEALSGLPMTAALEPLEHVAGTMSVACGGSFEIR
jgi:hypothetical protein